MKARGLCKEKNEVKKLLNPQNKLRGIRAESRNLDSNGEIEEELVAVKKLKLTNLKSIIAAVCASAEIHRLQKIRTKSDAIEWLRTHWAISKGTVRQWYEMEIEMETERRRVMGTIAQEKP